MGTIEKITKELSDLVDLDNVEISIGTWNGVHLFQSKPHIEIKFNGKLIYLELESHYQSNPSFICGKIIEEITFCRKHQG